MSPLLLLVSVIGLAALSAASPAGANEAFLCENGRIAYVEFGALELAKKTDPCIAGYFGGTVEGPQTDRAAAAPDPVVPQLRPLTDPEVAVIARRPLAPIMPARVRSLPMLAATIPPASVKLINAETPDAHWRRATD